jgi:type II secretory pathway component PulK
MRHPEDGYATPAAALISLAIAVVTAALVGRAVSELRLARAEFSRMSVEYDLASAHQLALLSIAGRSQTTVRSSP